MPSRDRSRQPLNSSNATYPSNLTRPNLRSVSQTRSETGFGRNQRLSNFYLDVKMKKSSTRPDFLGLNNVALIFTARSTSRRAHDIVYGRVSREYNNNDRISPSPVLTGCKHDERTGQVWRASRHTFPRSLCFGPRVKLTAGQRVHRCSDSAAARRHKAVFHFGEKNK